MLIFYIHFICGAEEDAVPNPRCEEIATLRCLVTANPLVQKTVYLQGSKGTGKNYVLEQVIGGDGFSVKKTTMESLRSDIDSLGREPMEGDREEEQAVRRRILVMDSVDRIWKDFEKDPHDYSGRAVSRESEMISLLQRVVAQDNLVLVCIGRNPLPSEIMRSAFTTVLFKDYTYAQKMDIYKGLYPQVEDDEQLSEHILCHADCPGVVRNLLGNLSKIVRQPTKEARGLIGSTQMVFLVERPNGETVGGITSVDCGLRGVGLARRTYTCAPDIPNCFTIESQKACFEIPWFVAMRRFPNRSAGQKPFFTGPWETEIEGKAGTMKGPSAGLSVYISLVSALFRHSVPSDLVCSARILPSGQIDQIGGVLAKYREAFRHGSIRRMLLSPDDVEEVKRTIPPRFLEVLPVEPVSTVEEAEKAVFGEALVDSERCESFDTAVDQTIGILHRVARGLLGGEGGDGEEDRHERQEHAVMDLVRTLAPLRWGHDCDCPKHP